jgi:hypothetical protein
MSFSTLTIGCYLSKLRAIIINKQAILENYRKTTYAMYLAGTLHANDLLGLLENINTVRMFVCAGLTAIRNTATNQTIETLLQL